MFAMSAANPVSAPITQDVMTIPRKLPDGPLNLVGLTRDAMRDALIAQGTPEKQAKMRVGQIWQWIYQWGVRDFDAMTNLSKAYRADLAEKFVIEIPEVVSKQVSADGTRKWHISPRHRTDRLKRACIRRCASIPIWSLVKPGAAPT